MSLSVSSDAVPPAPAGRPGPPGPSGPPDPERAAKMQIRQLSTAPWLSQALYAVAKLGVADLLADGARPVDELAKLTDAHPDTLYRFLRALASVDIFAEPEPRTFGLTPASEQLRTDLPGSMRHVVMMHGEETFRAWADVLHTVRTGKPAFDKVYGASFYSYIAEHPEAEQTFHAAMGVSGAPPLVVDALDLSWARAIVDVGGGSGSLLAHVLGKNGDARGALIDLPDAVSEGVRRLASEGLADRAECVPGSFFDGVPEGDAYLLSRVLHNWGDDEALAILRNIRSVIKPGGRLYVLDRLVPDVPGPHPGKIADLVMLVVLGGRDRTEAEYTALLETAGFTVDTVTAPPPGSDPRAESAITATPRF
jgi:SAM-dependent methyltransferase